MQPQVVVSGIADVQRALRAVSADFPKELRKANLAAAEKVRDTARSRAPRLTGRLAQSIASRADQRSASVKGGGARVPYFGFIDFGGSVGRNNSVTRPFIRKGRIIYPAIDERRSEIFDSYEHDINALIRRAGLQD